MKLLITGGYGFMGSHTVRHFYYSYPEYKIWNLDLLTYAANPLNLKDIEIAEKKNSRIGKRYNFVHGDICDHVLIDKLFKTHKFDAIINFAAETHVDRSIHESKHFITTNVQGVHTLLDAVRKYKTPKFIHISTDEVYGDRHGIDSAHEETAFSPSSPYSASKAAADFLIQSYVRTFNLPIIIVRPSNNFGTHQYPEKLIPLITTNVLEGKKIPIHGKGNQIRSWLHTSDLCKSLDVLLHKGRDGEIYNIGGVELRNIDMVKMITDLLGKKHKDHIEYTKDRPGQDKKYSLDSNKLKKHYGLIFGKPIIEKIKDIVFWYKENQDWWKAIKSTPSFKDHYIRQSKGKWF